MLAVDLMSIFALSLKALIWDFLSSKLSIYLVIDVLVFTLFDRFKFKF